MFWYPVRGYQITDSIVGSNYCGLVQIVGCGMNKILVQVAALAIVITAQPLSGESNLFQLMQSLHSAIEVNFVAVFMMGSLRGEVPEVQWKGAHFFERVKSSKLTWGQRIR